MLREISELESIGDSCYNLARTLKRHKNSQEEFNEKQLACIKRMFDLVEEAILKMNLLFSRPLAEVDINQSFNLENEINNFRGLVRTRNIEDVNNHTYSYTLGSMYMDLMNECEKLGDYVINVVEARAGIKFPES